MKTGRRHVILGLVLLLLITSRAVAADRPNILFIITDQHHARMLSSAGNPYLKTRAFDSHHDDCEACGAGSHLQ